MSAPLNDREVIKFLLFQQFYYGNDLIYGRTRDVSLQIKGSGKAIERFYELLVKKINLIRNGQYIQYLVYFSNEFMKFDIDFVYEQFMNNFRNLDENQKNLQIITSLLISEMLMKLRKDCFDEALNEIKRNLMKKASIVNKIMEKSKNETQHSITINEEFLDNRMDNLKRLFSLNDKNVGMIYNLSFLKTIAFRLKDKKVFKNTKKALNTYIDAIVEKIY